tara:strand:+ start:1026 stop:2393 length:1368 start_codon:yes stop_codon:yes gene_type:complete
LQRGRDYNLFPLISYFIVIYGKNTGCFLLSLYLISAKQEIEHIKTVHNTVHMYFFLNKPNSKTSAIRLRYYVKSEKQTFVYSTGISIEPKYWNKDSRMPKAKAGATGFELKQITNKLNRIVEQLHVSINNIELEKKQVTRSELKKRLDAKFKHVVVSGDSLTYLLDQYVEEKKTIGKYQSRTIEKYSALKNKITAYEKKTGNQIGGIKATQINKSFLIDFINFLRKDYQLTDITLNRNLGYLKTFIKWCKYNGIQIDESYNQVSVKTRDADHVSLTLDQVNALETLSLNKTLDKYRDLFLIGVYSGQRFSDYSVFKKADVLNGRIVKRAEKTDYKSYVPISNKLAVLLDKWEWRLPKVSNQKFNKNIKEVCRLAGFTNEITRTKFRGNKKIEEIKPFYICVGSHTARRTFITLAANNNVPDHVIMAICGIRDSKTLKTYKKFQEKELEKWVNSIF